jgi:hypothetical protein
VPCEGLRDKLRLVVPALALAVRMQWDGNHCIGLKFLSCVSKYLGEALGKPVSQPGDLLVF